MKVDPNKQYMTRGGDRVTNLHYHKTHRGDSYPWVGTIQGSNGADCWTDDGEYWGQGSLSQYDLIEVQPEKTMPAIDFTKPLQSTGGAPVTLITTEGRGPYPVLGYMGDGDTIMYWGKDGRNRSDRAFDLTNVPPPKQAIYLNLYSHNNCFKSREEADATAANVTHVDRVACIRIEYTEGQFDD